MVIGLVSILIPTYNREKYIVQCIESALAQTYGNIEIIICDNCSTDSTWDICCKYAKNNSIIKIFQHKKNVGPVRNWQKCIELATGEYAKILFSDDLISADFIEKTLVHLKSPEVGFVYSSAIIGPQEWEGVVFYRYSQEAVKKICSKTYLKQAIFGGPAFPVTPGCGIYRLLDFKEALWDTLPSKNFPEFNNNGAGPDLLSLFNIAIKYRHIVYLDQPLSFYRMHDESITIADVDGKLSNYYNRAKLIFLQKYFQRRDISLFCVSLWRTEIKSREKYLSLKAAMDKYDYPNIDVFQSVLDVLLKKPLWLIRILGYKFIRFR